MNSNNTLKILFISLILIEFFSCKESKNKIEKIDFAPEYKFSSEIEEKVAQDTVSWKYQLSAADYATKGDYQNALLHWDMAMGTREKNLTDEQIDSLHQKYSKTRATEYITNQAKNHQVVIINEAHHNSFHRVFTKSLLKKLFNHGYTNLGLEALGNGKNLDSTLNSRKYPVARTGHYIKDPQFGNLVREALEIGYTIFAYDNMDSRNGKQREIAQAKNIQNQIKAKPNEKFLIHSGYDHALEGNHKSWEKAMAGRLTEYTGINPLTVNQVIYSERSQPKFNHPILKAFNIQESTILIDENNRPLKYERGEAWTDLVVLHPNTEYIDERPGWLFENENKNVSINLNDIEIEYPIMVLAFKEGEDINKAIPVDITEIENKTDDCNLGLKEGVYEIVVTNAKESFKFERKVK